MVNLDTQSLRSKHVHVSYMSRVSGSHIEVQLVFLEVHEEDMIAELKCVAKNVLGKQEVITQIKVQGRCTQSDLLFT